MKFQIPSSILFGDRKMRTQRVLRQFGAAAILIVLSLPAFAQDVASSAREQERELIKLLESNVPAEQKAVPCKKLAIYGTDAAVPALAHLLADEQLASWALIALEAIPGSAPDDALQRGCRKVARKIVDWRHRFHGRFARIPDQSPCSPKNWMTLIPRWLRRLRCRLEKSGASRRRMRCGRPFAKPRSRFARRLRKVAFVAPKIFWRAENQWTQ